MLLRSWTVTLVVCALWGYFHEFRYQVQGLFWLAVPLAVLGGLALRSRRLDGSTDEEEPPHLVSLWDMLDSWGRVWSVILLGFWLSTLLPVLMLEIGALTGNFWIRCARGADLALPYVLPTSLLMGYLARLERTRGGAEPNLNLPLQLGLFFFVILLVLLTPPIGTLWSLPVLVLLSLTPWSSAQVCIYRAESSEDSGPPYHLGLAAVIEMLSLQMVGWGAILAFLEFFGSGVEGKYIEGVMMTLGTGLGCWLGGGLIWGLSDHVRRGLGQSAVQAVARLLYGSLRTPEVEPGP